MWMVIDAETGDIISRDHEVEPPAGEGEAIVAQAMAETMIWDAPSRGWVIATSLREKLWADAKVWRDRAEAWGCTTALGRVDTDADSQRKVSGAVQMALIAQLGGEPFSVDWTMQDNSTVAHDGAAMIAMGIAVGTHVAACHAAGLAKRAALEAAADDAALLAVDIAGGWPDARAA